VLATNRALRIRGMGNRYALPLIDPGGQTCVIMDKFSAISQRLVLTFSGKHRMSECSLRAG
jgi:hypothetical protein